MVPLTYSGERYTCYSDSLQNFSVIIPRCYKDVYVKGFFPRAARLWNSLSIECFPLTYDLSSFKSRIIRKLSKNFGISDGLDLIINIDLISFQVFFNVILISKWWL